MKSFKGILVVGLIALAFVAIASRVGAVRSFVFGGSA